MVCRNFILPEFCKPCLFFAFFNLRNLLYLRGCGRKVGQSRGRKEEVGILFTYEKKVRALQLYEQTHSVTETIRILGYPERATLYRWISEKGQPEKVRSTKRGENTPDHPRHPSVEVKLQVLHRCFEHGEDVKSVSEEIGYSRADRTQEGTASSA